MNGRDWAILLALSVLWGGSFFFIEIAVHTVAPLTLVLIRVSIAAAAVWLFMTERGQRVVIAGNAILAFFLLALLDTVLSFVTFAWPSPEIAYSIPSISNTPPPSAGVHAATYLPRDH